MEKHMKRKTKNPRRGAPLIHEDRGLLAAEPAEPRAAQKKPSAADADLTEPGITGNIERYWDADGLTPEQRTVKKLNLDNNTISARVDGLWRNFKIKELDQGSSDFQSTRWLQFMTRSSTQERALFGGVYCPAIISHGGIKRGDSLFKLNGAYKFVFPVPQGGVHRRNNQRAHGRRMVQTPTSAAPR